MKEYMEELYDLCDVLNREISEANAKIRSAGGKLSGSDLEYIDKLTHALKSIKTTLAMEEAESGRRSYAQRRDTMGRYTSRDDGMISELRALMEDAPDERTRREFRSFINRIER